jgi:hypothetical protein
VTFDRIEHWTHFHKGGSKVARALATRVLLLSESLEADVRTDNIWPNRKAAQRDQEFQGLKAALGTDLCLGHPVYRDSIYQMSQANAAAVVASFRLPPTKGRGGPQTPFRALVLASVEEARAVLEGVVGPLAEFTILASTPEARSPARPAPPAPAPAPAPAPVATLLRPPPAAPAVLHVEPKDVPDRRPNRPVWPAVLGARGP